MEFSEGWFWNLFQIEGFEREVNHEHKGIWYQSNGQMGKWANKIFADYEQIISRRLIDYD